MNNKEKDNIEKNDEVRETSKEILYEDSEGNYRYRGFWSGVGDQ